jgi:hypothetical protein
MMQKGEEVWHRLRLRKRRFAKETRAQLGVCTALRLRCLGSGIKSRQAIRAPSASGVAATTLDSPPPQLCSAFALGGASMAYLR